LPPLKFEYVKITFSKLVSPNFSLNSRFDFIIVS
jgi:hypothetical protein